LEQMRRLATIASIGASTRIAGSTLSNQEVATLLADPERRPPSSQDEEEVAGGRRRRRVPTPLHRTSNRRAAPETRRPFFFCRAGIWRNTCARRRRLAPALRTPARRRSVPPLRSPELFLSNDGASTHSLLSRAHPEGRDE
jgi:hypothetical protein